MPIQNTPAAIGASSHHSRLLRSGMRAASAVRTSAEADAPVEPEHVGGAEDDPGGGDRATQLLIA